MELSVLVIVMLPVPLAIDSENFKTKEVLMGILVALLVGVDVGKRVGGSVSFLVVNLVSSSPAKKL